MYKKQGQREIIVERERKIKIKVQMDRREHIDLLLISFPISLNKHCYRLNGPYTINGCETKPVPGFANNFFFFTLTTCPFDEKLKRNKNKILKKRSDKQRNKLTK